ncbi:MAG: nicotinate phosphoribosyltransferase [Nitrosarchaeum sp.]|nr:nicotinate phosphoribosyltransferase [Nitrosarchaeum sp.]
MEPIITSLLDLDKYKLTMAQIVKSLHPDVRVEYTFKNRTKIKLGNFIDHVELHEQIKHIQNLKFTPDELAFLKTDSVFAPINFVDFLAEINGRGFSFYSGKTIDNDIHLRFQGPWYIAILYETLILSLINEMYTTTIMNNLSDGGKAALYNYENENFISKSNSLSANPDIKIIEFGTRRRFSKVHQRKILARLIEYNSKNLVGTSNVALAKELQIKSVGTVAHEFFMVRAAIDNAKGKLKTSQKESIKAWYDYYKHPLSILLTDTFGTDSFFEDFDEEMSNNCMGVRQDSGDPFQFGEKTIAHYKKYGIDPMTKTVVFSDGLDVSMILKLYDRFKNDFQMSFGWGTNLTNDVGIKPLSMVIKATEVSALTDKIYGESTVKLSDNLAKATGSPEMIEFYKKAFNYNKNDFVETTY